MEVRYSSDLASKSSFIKYGRRLAVNPSLFFLSSISMEFPVATTTISWKLSSPLLCPKPSFDGFCKFYPDFPSRRRFKCCSNSKQILPIEYSIDRNSSSSSSSSQILNREGSVNLWEDNEIVEVIGIGSRKDAVLDFCLRSPSVSRRLRFWNILAKETDKVQLQQCLLGDDITKTIVEAPLSMQSRSKAVILVAGASYGSDHNTMHDMLEAIKLADGFVVTILLKPFRFEGRRRQDEVKDLLCKLQGLTDFCIMVEADALLEKDLVTLDEALQTANKAVLMALNAISILTSEVNIKFLDTSERSMKELRVPDLKKILGSYKEAKIGYGVGYNVETSVVRAIYDCPFVGSGVKDLDGIVVFILATSGAVDDSKIHDILCTFRQATEWKGGIITSVVLEPDLSPNLFATTIFTIGCTRQESSPKDGIFARLVQRFPSIFKFLRPDSQLENIQENSSTENSTFSSQGTKLTNFEMPTINSSNGSSEDFNGDSLEVLSRLSNDTDEATLSRNFGGNGQSDGAFRETFFNELSEGSPTFQRELLIGHNRSGYQIAEESTNDSKSGAAFVLDNLNAYKLPVGVKASGDMKDGPKGSRVVHYTEENSEFEMKLETQLSMGMSLDESTDASSEALADFNIYTSARQNGVYPDVSKKNGKLSARAASMLEAERDSQKKWSPIAEIDYRGGIYVGRCQGGLPEGKGRLSLGDGSMYDGMWRYGKRSGLGTFRFSNGDVFRGSWRDDAMHGKGWFYFHTGDRWFVNFWKGKANGEGRFYSKNGDIFFGYFKDGWRDGHFLCIDVSGSRCLEIWNEGVLVSRKLLESDDGTS